MSSFTLGLDLDGVVVDYLSALRESVAKARRIDPEDLSPEVDWHFSSWDLSSYLESHLLAVTEDRIYLKAQPYPGAVSTLQDLKKTGIQIHIVTNRFLGPTETHSLVLQDTLAWLDIYKIPYDHITITHEKSSVEASLYIDDSPQVINELQKNGRDVLIFDRSWNKGVPGTRVSSWGEAHQAIKQIFTRQLSARESLNPKNRFLL